MWQAKTLQGEVMELCGPRFRCKKSHLHGALWGRGTFWWPQTFTSRGTVGLCRTSCHVQSQTESNMDWFIPAQWNWKNTFNVPKCVCTVNIYSVCLCKYNIYIYIYIVSIQYISYTHHPFYLYIHTCIHYCYFRSVITLWRQRFKIYVVLFQHKSLSLSSPGIFHLASWMFSSGSCLTHCEFTERSGRRMKHSISNRVEKESLRSEL